MGGNVEGVGTGGEGKGGVPAMGGPGERGPGGCRGKGGGGFRQWVPRRGGSWGKGGSQEGGLHPAPPHTHPRAGEPPQQGKGISGGAPVTSPLSPGCWGGGGAACPSPSCTPSPAGPPGAAVLVCLCHGHLCNGNASGRGGGGGALGPGEAPPDSGMGGAARGPLGMREWGSFGGSWEMKGSWRGGFQWVGGGVLGAVGDTEGAQRDAETLRGLMEMGEGTQGDTKHPWGVGSSGLWGCGIHRGWRSMGGWELGWGGGDPWVGTWSHRGFLWGGRPTQGRGSLGGLCPPIKG